MEKQDIVKEMDSIISSVSVCKTALEAIGTTEATYSITAVMDNVYKRLNKLAEIIDEDTAVSYHYIDRQSNMQKITTL